jgi:nitrogenase molybdenum-cofactor synthesis protein NifE
MPWLDINQERHHAYAGYEGMVELVHEIDRALQNPVWQQVRIPAPWGDDGLSLAHDLPAPSVSTAEPAAVVSDEVTALLGGVAARAMGLEPDEVPS